MKALPACAGALNLTIHSLELVLGAACLCRYPKPHHSLELVPGAACLGVV